MLFRNVWHPVNCQSKREREREYSNPSLIDRSDQNKRQCQTTGWVFFHFFLLFSAEQILWFNFQFYQRPPSDLFWRESVTKLTRKISQPNKKPFKPGIWEIYHLKIVFNEQKRLNGEQTLGTFLFLLNKILKTIIR